MQKFRASGLSGKRALSQLPGVWAAPGRSSPESVSFGCAANGEAKRLCRGRKPLSSNAAPRALTAPGETEARSSAVTEQGHRLRVSCVAAPGGVCCAPPGSAPGCRRGRAVLGWAGRLPLDNGSLVQPREPSRPRPGCPGHRGERLLHSRPIQRQLRGGRDRRAALGPRLGDSAGLPAGLGDTGPQRGLGDNPAHPGDLSGTRPRSAPQSERPAGVSRSPGNDKERFASLFCVCPCLAWVQR